MLTLLLLLLIVFWLFGYVTVPFIVIPSTVITVINGQSITLWDIFILLIISWIVGVLPSPFRQLAGIVLVFWILSRLGLFFFAGISSLLLVVIIVGLIVYLISGI